MFTECPLSGVRVGAEARRNYLWAELMHRTFEIDVLACPRCGGRLAVVALIEDPRVIQRMLGHLKLPTEVPAARPARSPPLPWRRPDGDEGAPCPSPAPPARGPGGWYDPDVDVP